MIVRQVDNLRSGCISFRVPTKEKRPRATNPKGLYIHN